jgi:hypothetical protein
MSNNEAKFLLNAYRPGGADAADPAFGEALAQAKSDPALGAWFAREQAHAQAMASKLREIAPPPGLREAILAGGRATERAHPTRGQYGWLAWVGIAASIAVLAAVTTSLWRRSAVDVPGLVAFAVDDVQHGRHGGHGGPEKTLQAELSQTSARLSAGVPIDFRTLAGTGCRTLRVGGHDVLEVCFVRGGAEFHCYIGRAIDFGREAASPGPSFIQQGVLAAATWRTGDYRYVVVGDAGLDAVKQLL